MATKKVIRTKKKETNARVKGHEPVKLSKMSDKQRWVTGIVMLLLGVYCYYAFITAQPTIIDKIIGKYILMYLFGNAVPLICLTTIVCGILLMLDKLEDYKKTIGYVFLIILNFMIFLSSLIPNLTEGYKVVDLFELAMYGGYGGIIGTIFAYFLKAIFKEVGTIIILVILTFVELILIFKDNFPNVYERVISSDFGFLYLKDKYLDYQENRETKQKIKKKKAEEQQIKPDQELDMITDNPVEYPVDDSIDGLFEDDPEFKFKTEAFEPIEVKKKRHPELEDYMFFMDDQKPSEKDPVPTKEKKEKKATKSKQKADNYQYPSIELLTTPRAESSVSKEEIKDKAKRIQETLKDFKVDASIRNFETGPSITRFEVKPAPGVKVSKILNLADDLALRLATSDIRIESPIPGKDAIGIEVPNNKSNLVHLREIIDSDDFESSDNKLPFAVGKTLEGNNIIGDISAMPHLLIAGSTGSGKSVCINSIIISLLYRESPDDLKLILIDPKMVELNQYNHIPHLMVPVVTDPQKAEGALGWAIDEMEKRYNLFSENGVRDLETYNELKREQKEATIPRIVIVIDELADLMMTSPKEVEAAICRIAQKARACGIHLIIATQRPSVDVITGLIKSNIPSRIAFAVASNTDSRTILDSVGAEKLLGKGDMLYKPVWLSKPLRIQCPFVSDREIAQVINSIKTEEKPDYSEEISNSIDQHVKEKQKKKSKKNRDKLYDEAVEVAFTNKQLSTSMLQRRLGIGYARAGRLIDSLEADGIISGPNGSKPRKLLISEGEYSG